MAIKLLQNKIINKQYGIFGYSRIIRYIYLLELIFTSDELLNIMFTTNV